jgi:hypothetical protein
MSRCFHFTALSTGFATREEKSVSPSIVIHPSGKTMKYSGSAVYSACDKHHGPPVLTLRRTTSSDTAGKRCHQHQKTSPASALLFDPARGQRSSPAGACSQVLAGSDSHAALRSGRNRSGRITSDAVSDRSRPSCRARTWSDHPPGRCADVAPLRSCRPLFGPPGRQWPEAAVAVTMAGVVSGAPCSTMSTLIPTVRQEILPPLKDSHACRSP